MQQPGAIAANWFKLSFPCGKAPLTRAGPQMYKRL
jgi:hypothetical protein